MSEPRCAAAGHNGNAEIDHKKWRARKMAWWDSVSVMPAELPDSKEPDGKPIRWTNTDKLVCWRIASRCNPNHVGAWPSLATIAKELNVGESTVWTSLKKAVDLGVLIKIRPGGGDNAAVYDINLDHFESEPEAPTRSGSDIWNSQEQRDGYARRRLAEIIGEDGWETIVAAECPEHPEHRTAVRTVLRVARAHNIGWKSPARRAAGKLET